MEYDSLMLILECRERMVVRRDDYTGGALSGDCLEHQVKQDCHDVLHYAYLQLAQVHIQVVEEEPPTEAYESVEASRSDCMDKQQAHELRNASDVLELASQSVEKRIG